MAVAAPPGGVKRMMESFVKFEPAMVTGVAALLTGTVFGTTEVTAGVQALTVPAVADTTAGDKGAENRA
jgi:hypothetical protein